jgi:hypothetical protein
VDAAQGGAEAPVAGGAVEHVAAGTRQPVGLLVDAALRRGEPQRPKSHVAHRAADRADVPRVLGSGQHDDDVVEEELLRTGTGV